MTTVTADIIQATVTDEPVKVRRAVHNDPTDPTKQIKFDLSGTNVNFATEFITNIPTDTSFIFPDSSSLVTSITDDVFTATQTFTEMNQGTLVPVTSNVTIDGLTPGTLTNTVLSYISANPGSPKASVIAFVISGTPVTTSTLNLKFNTPASSTSTISLPSVTSTFLDINAANTFPQLQTFNNGIKTNTATPIPVNSDLTFNPNGTGAVVVNNTDKIDTLQATSNTSLLLSGNGTGVVNFGTSGFKFANEVLKDFTSNTYTTAFTVGAFSTGNLTLKYERLGTEVTIFVPAATGTPAVDGVWTANTAMPTIIRPSNEQQIRASCGIRNGTQRFQLCVKISTGGILTLGLIDLLTGFGNSSTCGWSNAWSFSYSLN